jgi:glycerol dehydrogenase
LTLAELGLQNLPREKAWAIAERAVAPGESAHNEPFEVTAVNLMDAIFAADAIGAAFKARASR